MFALNKNNGEFVANSNTIVFSFSTWQIGTFFSASYERSWITKI